MSHVPFIEFIRINKQFIQYFITSSSYYSKQFSFENEKEKENQYSHLILLEPSTVI